MMHQEVARLLGAYKDGELGAEMRAGVARHLAECPLCSRDLAGMHALGARLREWPAPVRLVELEAAFWSRLAPRLPARAGEQPASTPLRSWRDALVPLALVVGGAFVQAGALLTLVVSVLMMSGAFSGVEAWLVQTLGSASGVTAGSLAQLTWPGWLASEALSLFGPAGAQFVTDLESLLGWVAPSLVFIALSLFVFVALSGWAGLRLTRRAGLKMKEN